MKSKSYLINAMIESRIRLGGKYILKMDCSLDWLLSIWWFMIFYY